MPEESRAELDRKDWDLIAACMVHVGNLGTKWGMEPHFECRKADLKDLHIAFAAVR